MKKLTLMIVGSIILFIYLSTSSMTLSLLNSSHQSNGLQVTYPNGGETLSGNVTVLWSLEQEYTSTVNFFSVFYSPDNGKNWIQLAFAIIAESYKWNTPIYENYGTNFLIKVIASSKEWENKEDISDEPFKIDNRNNFLIGNLTIENVTFLVFITSILLISSIGFGYYFINSKLSRESINGLFQFDKIKYLKEISHKLIIGLDNIKYGFIDESIDIPSIDSVIHPSSMVEYFPSEIQYELRSEIKGRSVLTLIEIAYQDPRDTNPAKLAKSLNIPLSTLSKEIKKLKRLNYVDTHISSQVVKDARYRNFKITLKGFKFLSILNSALKLTLNRAKRNGLLEQSF
ncbi:MAG: hypothetical protein ACFFAU_03150 [Candidatus Hodarchaeota archaeon]